MGIQGVHVAWVLFSCNFWENHNFLNIVNFEEMLCEEDLICHFNSSHSFQIETSYITELLYGFVLLNIVSFEEILQSES
jgi:hypothetical protein